MKFTQSGHGSPVVLVHGALTDGRMWHSIEPLLARRYRVYSPPLRGFYGGEPLQNEAPAFGYDAHADDRPLHRGSRR